MTTLSVMTTVEVRLVTCYSCGVQFGLPVRYYDKRIEDHADWWCPNGHRQHFIGKTEAEKLREQLEVEQRDKIYYRNRLETERRSHSATKGQLTKTRKRAAKGVCPEPTCKRSFANVARHVASQHPDFNPEQHG